MNGTFMDMRYTYEELREAYQNLLKENAVLNQEIQRLKSGNAGGAVGCSTLLPKEQPDVRLSLEEKVALFRSLFREVGKMYLPDVGIAVRPTSPDISRYV